MTKRKSDQLLPHNTKKITKCNESTAAHSYSSNNDMKRRTTIPLTTQALDQLIVQYINLLDKRSEDYGCIAEFNLAMDDTRQMISIAPTCLKGYIRLGDLYAMRGLQADAIRILEQGLENIPNDKQDDEQLQKDLATLRQQLDTAKEKSQKRLDIITNLPYDTVEIILGFLTTKECIALLGVSKAWQTKLSFYSEIWEDITIRKRDEWTVNEVFLFARAVGHLTTSIKMDGLGNNVCEFVFSAITSNFFSNLNTIELKDCTVTNVNGLFSALGALSKTLKNFIMNNSIFGEVYAIPFKNVISTCPNLEMFDYQNGNTITKEYEVGFLWPGISSSLTDLSLITSKQLKAKDIQQIIEMCPKLSSLNIGNCELAALKSIDRICQNLETFYFNYGRPVDDGDDDDDSTDGDYEEDNSDYANTDDMTLTTTDGTEIITTKDSDITAECAERNIQELGITLTDSPSYFKSFFQTNCTSIKKLSVNILSKTSSNVDIDWTPWVSICDFTKLRSLEIDFIDKTPGLSNIAAQLISKSPLLHELKFMECVVQGKELITAIKNLLHLETLILSYCEGNVQDLQKLLIGLGRKRTLQKLVLDDPGFRLHSLLEPIAHISTLRKLEIKFPEVEFNDYHAIHRFCDHMKTHSSIESIKLCYVCGIDDDQLSKLSKNKGLKRLCLSGISGITDEGVQVFIDRPSFKLVLVDCDDITFNYP